MIRQFLAPSGQGLPAPLSRREALGQAWTVALLLAGCSDFHGRPIGKLDPRVPALLEATLSVDLHSHAAGANASAVPKFDLAAHMKAGRMSAVCLCHSADGPVIRRTTGGGRMRATREPQPGELYRHTQARLAFMDDLVSKRGMKRVLSPQHLDAAKAAGQPALIGTIEGCHFMEGRLERIQEVHERGIRHLQLVHYLPSDLGDQQTEEPVHGGLSTLGGHVIRECNRLGIVVDVAHGTFELVQQAAKISTTPLILSHSSLARGLPNPTSRLISHPHAKLVAETGGVIGVWPSGIAFPNPRAWVAGIAQAVDVVGVDHVGIGTDMEGGANEVWSDYADLPAVADLLLQQGFSPAEAGQLLGGNYVRVFRKVAELRKA